MNLIIILGFISLVNGNICNFEDCESCVSLKQCQWVLIKFPWAHGSCFQRGISIQHLASNTLNTRGCNRMRKLETTLREMYPPHIPNISIRRGTIIRTATPTLPPVTTPRITKTETTRVYIRPTFPPRPLVTEVLRKTTTPPPTTPPPQTTVRPTRRILPPRIKAPVTTQATTTTKVTFSTFTTPSVPPTTVPLTPRTIVTTPMTTQTPILYRETPKFVNTRRIGKTPTFSTFTTTIMPLRTTVPSSSLAISTPWEVSSATPFERNQEPPSTTMVKAITFPAFTTSSETPPQSVPQAERTPTNHVTSTEISIATPPESNLLLPYEIDQSTPLAYTTSTLIPSTTSSLSSCTNCMHYYGGYIIIAAVTVLFIFLMANALFMNCHFFCRALCKFLSSHYFDKFNFH